MINIQQIHMVDIHEIKQNYISHHIYKKLKQLSESAVGNI
jgi:hypothetical protein